jgi:hypothetical protein
LGAAAYGLPIVWDPAAVSPSQAALDAAFGPLWCYPPSVIARCQIKGVTIAIRPAAAYTGSAPNTMPPYNAGFTMSGAGRAETLTRTACFRSDQWTNTTASIVASVLGAVGIHEVAHVLEAANAGMGYLVRHSSGTYYGSSTNLVALDLRNHPFIQQIAQGFDAAEFVPEYMSAFFQKVAAPTLRFPEGYAFVTQTGTNVTATSRWTSLNTLNGVPGAAATGEALLREYFGLGSSTWAPTSGQAATLATYYS